jgi:cobalt-zinc-cadmium efflux system outer membrane protein
LGNSLLTRNYDTIVAVNQLIEIAGKRHDRQMAARAGILGAKARFYDAKRTLDQGVTKAYIAALLAEDKVGILNESSHLLRHEADIAGARFKAGDISDSDKKQIEINAEQYELQAKSAEAAAVQARIAVEILMGVPQPKGNYLSAGSLHDLVEAPLPSAAKSGPEAARPDVLAAEADLKGAKANLQLQKAIRIPDPTILIQYEHEPPGGGPPMDTVGIGVSFPLPLWNLNGGNIKAAQASVDQFAWAAGKVRTQMEADISNAESVYSEAHARWLSYRDKTAPKSTQVRESVAFAYEKGGASLVDLLDAERTDNDIRLATVQAISDTASAIADLLAARNVLTQTKLETRP